MQVLFVSVNTEAHAIPVYLFVFLICRGRDRGLPLKYDANQGLFTQR